MSEENSRTPVDVLEQDVPVGGVFDGVQPRAAIATLPVGISTVREVPALRVAAGWFPLTQTGSAQRIGKDPRRRTLHLAADPSATVGALVVIATTQQEAQDGYGYRLTAGSRLTISTADQLWFRPVAADIGISFLMEIDQG